MPKELKLFLKEELTFIEKFYKLMDILLSSQQNFKIESLFFMGLNYLQILSIFYSEQIHLFDPIKSTSDLFLNYIEKIIRIKEIFRNNNKGLNVLIYCLFIITILFILYFIFIITQINNNSIYSFNKIVFHYLLKIFMFLEFNIILDICFSNYCFGFTENNPNFDEIVKCKGNNRIVISIISGIFILLAFSLHIFFQIFYSDLFFFSSSCFAKMSCNYDYYMDINCLINSFLLVQSYYLTKEIFLIFNLFYSIFMLIYYLNFYFYYDSGINILAGIFHSLYVWTSIFGIIFAYIDFREKGIIYIFSSIIICFCYFNLKNKIEKDIFYKKSPKKIKNIHHLLFFFKHFTDKIIRIDENSENRAFVASVLELIFEEAPGKSSDEINGEIYIPLENKWRDPKKSKIEDEAFKKYSIVIILNYFIFNRENFPDIYFNLSLYYLKVIGNYCQSMYYFQKISELKLSYKEYFTYMRLKIKIQNALIQNLKPSDEQNVILENVNISMYYKYDSLSQNFIEEITRDIELSLEFWKTFKRYAKDPNFKLNFNKLFKLTDKIQTTKKTIEKMWKELLKIYNGVNEYFEFYNDYIEQINDDDLKKRDLDSLKRKKGYFNDHLSNNYYSVLFSRDTGIIIADGDIGSEGTIKHCNKKIGNIFNYNISDLKENNVNKLMPKLFEKQHSKYMERYFRIGAKKYIETNDFKTFAKDSNNSILQVKLGLKLLPILNYNVFFVGLIIKENFDDIILIDKDFNIQGMSSKLMKILNIENNYLFQDNEIPFYVICKKFVNFFNIFLKNKKNISINELDKKATTIINEEKNNIINGFEGKDIENKKSNELHDNIEINENVELEYEIKIPQFLIDYSEKTKYKMNKDYRDSFFNEEELENDNYDNNESENIDSEDDDDEDNLLTQEKDINNNLSQKKKISNHIFKDYSTPTPTPNPGSICGDNVKSVILSERTKINQNCKEERIYFEKISQYKNLFSEEKFNELEDLIDFCNKNSSSSEYKFNFTFDNNKFGNEISYIVRCIDDKNQDGQSDEKSIGDLDPKAIKYKKEKAEAIKPLFELLQYEREEILKLPDIFLKLSLENKEFQELLEQSKNEIMTSSKTHGEKKTEVMEDENSSQTSQAGFDSGLVKKNRIEEIRANLFNNVSNFFTLKYIKMSIILIMIFTISFSVIYSFFIVNFNSSLKSVSIVNLDLFQTTLWTTELVSIFISLKTLLMIKLDKINIDYMNYESDVISTNYDYYIEMQKIAFNLYNNLKLFYGKLEMEIPNYLNESELLSLYWDHIKIAYINDDYMQFGWINNQSFPTAMDQFLCNGIMFLKYNYSDEFINSKINNDYFESFFNYSSHLIIESAYNNIIPDQFTKLKKIPEIFSKYNIRKKVIMILIIAIFAGCLILLFLLYFIMIRTTNKSMADGFKKITKIKLEKIEERIKKIDIFNYNLKKFRDRDSNFEDTIIQTEIKYEQISQKKVLQTYKSSSSLEHNINEKLEKKIYEEKVSLVDNNGFNIDVNRYLSLTILKEYFFLSGIIVIIFCVFIALIYYISLTMIQDINQLLIIEKFIYGKLIASSSEILEVKCFITGCKNDTSLDYSAFQSYSDIKNVIKGLRNFPQIEDYYNNRYLLDACYASIDKNIENEKYKKCLNDSIILSANNTDNLIKLIDNIIDNIYKKDDMDIYVYKTTDDPTKYRLHLFNETNFKNIEYIFFNYIFPVGDLFDDSIRENLDYYLLNKKKILICLVFGLATIIILYSILFLSLYIPRLIHFLSVSRSVMKIIPTSIIMITQELENWIENKNSDLTIC